MSDDDSQLKQRATRSTSIVVTVQLVACAVMLIGTSACALLWPGAVTIVWCVASGVVILGLFAALWPFQSKDATGTDRVVEWIGRILGVVAGLVSLLFSTWKLHALMAPAIIGGRARLLFPWAGVFVVLLTVLIVVAFGLQMARRLRTHLIRSISENVFAGIAAVSIGGWPFFAFSVRILADGYQTRFALPLLIMTVLAFMALLSIGAASTLWWRDIKDGESGVWIGVGLLPVMFAGVIMYLLSIGVFYLLF